MITKEDLQERGFQFQEAGNHLYKDYDGVAHLMVKDAIGKKYSVEALFIDFTKFDCYVGTPSWFLKAYFDHPTSDFRVEVADSDMGLDKSLEYLEEIWDKMDCDYYEMYADA